MDGPIIADSPSVACMLGDGGFLKAGVQSEEGRWG